MSKKRSFPEKVLYAVIFAALLWVLFRYALWAFLPFIVSWLFALAVFPAVNFISKKSGIPRKAISTLLVLVISAAAVTVVVLLSERLIYEVTAFLQRIIENADIYADYLTDLLGRAKKRFGFLEGLDDEYFVETALGIVKETAVKTAGGIPGFAADCIEFFPNLIFSVVVFILSAIYVTADLDRINEFLMSMLPLSASEGIKKAAHELKKTGGRYIRSYAVIFVVTFTELLTGFLILGIKYEFSLALIIALIDLLPVFGVGIALVPWGAVLIISGSYYTGFGIMILFGVILIVRQIIEPKIVSENIGLPPLVMLTAMYAGFRLFGVGGIFLLPVAAVLVKCLNEAGVIKLWQKE